MLSKTATTRQAPDLDLGRAVGRRLYPATLVIAVLIGLGFPAVFFVLEQRSLQTSARTYAVELAQDLRDAVLESPRTWRAQAERHLDVVGEALAGRGVVAIRITDRGGAPVATYHSTADGRGWPERLAPTASTPLDELGDVATSVDPAGMVKTTGLLLLVSSVVALSLALFIQAFPVRFLKTMERRIHGLVDQIQRSNADLEVRAERLATLASLTQLAVSAIDVRDVSDAISRAATVVLGARTTRVWIDDPDANVLRVAGSFSTEPIAAGPGTEFSVMARGTGVIGEVMRTGVPAFIRDIQDDQRFVNQALATSAGFHGAAMIPLVTADVIVGILTIFFADRWEVADEDRHLIDLLAGHAAIAIEKARLYRESQRALADLHVKNAELDSFVYSVSHDLKAPLVAVQGMAGALREDCGAELDRHGRHYLDRLQANVEQMERLIQDLLALPRIGRESQTPETVSVAELVDDIVAEYSSVIRARGIKVTVTDVGTLHGVRTQIEQVFTNLIGNAIKYAGHVDSPSIEIGTAERGAFVECHVKDNGIGIDPAYHAKVFEIFQRLQDVDVEGTGVGLAIVKKIVEAAGGRIWVESAKGQGATFHFTWPACRQAGSVQ